MLNVKTLPLLTICLILAIMKDDAMADQMFMFATMAGTMAAFAAVLFVSRGIRMRASTINNRQESSISPSNNESNKGKKVKRYTSDGKPVYE